jgi:16S rRNA (guanine527-N7)-methyltransferase
MNEDEAKKSLKTILNFSENDIYRLDLFRIMLLDFNHKYNLISRKTENSIWSRHILDSAQLLRLFDINSKLTMVDLGSGAGFPGIVIAIFNKNEDFHVKLYEKSPVKRDFLNKVKEKLDIKLEVLENVYNDKINADILVSRAFKKLEEIVRISRETVRKPHRLIILKGKNAKTEINNVSLGHNSSYKLVDSITDNDSKIIVIEVK